MDLTAVQHRVVTATVLCFHNVHHLSRAALLINGLDNNPADDYLIYACLYAVSLIFRNLTSEFHFVTNPMSRNELPI